MAATPIADFRRYQQLCRTAPDEAVALKRSIAESNLGLVYSMARKARNVNPAQYEDAISEGVAALMRAIDKFDPGRGFRFSTYACRSIWKSFSNIKRDCCKRLRERELPELPMADPRAKVADAGAIRAEMLELLDCLPVRTRKIIERRFYHSETLEEIGAYFGLSKERVRQTINNGLETMRKWLE